MQLVKNILGARNEGVVSVSVLSQSLHFVVLEVIVSVACYGQIYSGFALFLNEVLKAALSGYAEIEISVSKYKYAVIAVLVVILLKVGIGICKTLAAVCAAADTVDTENCLNTSGHVAAVEILCNCHCFVGVCNNGKLVALSELAYYRSHRHLYKHPS